MTGSSCITNDLSLKFIEGYITVFLIAMEIFMGSKKLKPKTVTIGCVECTVRVVDENDAPLAG